MILSYFWMAQENVPDDIGFSLYHGAHLIWLVILISGIVFAARRFRKSSIGKLTERQDCLLRFLRIMAWGMVLLEVMKIGILLVTGQFYVAYFPLDLCGISIVLEVVAVYWQNPYLLECVYSLSLPGACLALLFPNWNKLPIWNYFCIHGFLLHGLLVMIPVLLLSCGVMQPCARRLPFCFACIAVACVPIWLFNRAYGTNFFFLARPSKGSPLVWFEKTFGNYRIGLPILMGIIWLGMYGVPALYKLYKRHRQNASA